MGVKKFLAFDIGASNGRAIVGEWDGARLTCEDIYHFPNCPVQVGDDLYWDVLRLFGDIKSGLIEYARRFGPDVDGIGIDTWGVDFGLLDKDGRLLANPHHYRDKRSIGMPDAIRGVMNAHAIYHQTGVQLEQVGSISQMFALASSKSPLLEVADCFLMIPSLFAYFLTGERVDEHSNISNTALYSFEHDAPADDILDRLGIPRRVMPQVVKPGTVLGPLLQSVRVETGIGAAPVIAPATHDTASAVISVPADSSTNWAFLSCGTWSVLGVETDKPVTSMEGYNAGVTSAATADGKYMPRLNITGLWIVQELRRIWERHGESMDWARMVALAEAAEPFTAFIDVDDPAFANPQDMSKAILACLEKTGQQTPKDKGTIIRIALESLALKYRKALNRIENLTGANVDVLHIVGGGVNNKLLCRFTAEATGKRVLAGPAEATSIGNLLVQMVGAGVFGSVAEGRLALRPSMDVAEYTPAVLSGWDQAYAIYLKLLER